MGQDLKNEDILKGIGISPGIAIGRSYLLHKPNEITYAKKLGSEDIPNELKRLYKAIEGAKDRVLAMKSDLNNKLDKENLKIFDSQYIILSDPIFIEEIISNIKERLVNAEYSVKVTAENWTYKLSKIPNQYLVERATDIRDIALLIIEELLLFGEENKFCLIEPTIIVSEFLTLTDIARLEKEKVLAFVITHGGYTSHAAIVARSLNIPAVSMIKNAHIDIKNRSNIIVDGIRGYCIVEPSKKAVTLYTKKRDYYKNKLEQLEKLNKYDAVSIDDIPIELQANLEIVEELPLIKKYNTGGIGLFRTEYLIDYSQNLPGEKLQTTYYSRVLSADKKLPVTIRTFDVGGDKMIRRIEEYNEANPFLGLRAIRFQLLHPNLLRVQLRSLLKANKYGNLKIMFPMVTTIDEIKSLRKITKEEAEEIKKEGGVIRPYKFGIMVEVPSIIFVADKAAKYVDFFSIGTNDLLQYTLAVDRGNEQVSYLYNNFDPAFVRLLKLFMEKVEGFNKDVSVCGEMAGDSLGFILLLILGVRSFSMVPWKIPIIKKLLSTLKISELKEHYKKIKDIETARKVEQYLKNEFKENLRSIKEFGFR